MAINPVKQGLFKVDSDVESVSGIDQEIDELPSAQFDE